MADQKPGADKPTTATRSEAAAKPAAPAAATSARPAQSGTQSGAPAASPAASPAPQGAAQSNAQSASSGATSAGAQGQNRSVGLAVRLAPVDDNDLPVMSNYTAVNVATGIVYVDFGFLEPGLLTALPRLFQQGAQLPEAVNGKLGVRVGMGIDTLVNLQQQLGQVIANLQAGVEAARKQ